MEPWMVRRWQTGPLALSARAAQLLLGLGVPLVLFPGCIGFNVHVSSLGLVCGCFDVER